MASSLPILLALSSLSTLSAAYTWNFATPPQQCSNLTVSLVGSGGVPPYRLLVLPSGPTPLSSGVEVRRILDVPFPDGSTSLSFQLKYPANSQLVAVVSDSTAFGSGGTSVAAQVATSSDTSCFNATAQPAPPDFVFSIDPANQIVQCASTRIWWDNSTVQGTPNFLGVIPGGESFSIPESNITNVQSEGTGFSWAPSIRAGTTLILVGGDNRGNGSAGSTTNLVSAGIQNDISCLSNASPSSTAGNPAGGTYPTGSTGGSLTGENSTSRTNVGAIVGGVIGAVSFIIACVGLFWVFRRRRKSHKKTKKLPTDILDADDDDDGPRTMGQNELPQNYQPEPFMVPIPEPTPSEFDDEFSTGRPFSPGTRTSFYTRSSTPDIGAGLPNGDSSVGRKGGAPRPMRAVNIIQHHDAGPNNGEREEPVETIELPPAYTMVRTTRGSGGGGNGDGPSTTAADN